MSSGLSHSISLGLTKEVKNTKQTHLVHDKVKPYVFFPINGSGGVGALI